MGQLTIPEQKQLDQLEAVVDAFQVAYMDAGQALMVIRDKKLWRHVAKTFEEYAKQRFTYSRAHSYRLISAYEAVRDTEDILSPIGDKKLESPRTEGVARELAKAESPEKRADLWSAVHKHNQGKSPGLISAALVAKVRKWLFPPAPSDNGEAPPKVAKAALELLTKFKPTAEQLTALAQYEEETQVELAESVASGIQSLDQAVETGDVPEETAAQATVRKNKEIDSHCRTIKKVTKDCPEDPWIVHQGLKNNALADIDRYCQQLRLAKCKHVCPGCEGAGCKYCLETGRMPDYFFKQMSM